MNHIIGLFEEQTGTTVASKFVYNVASYLNYSGTRPLSLKAQFSRLIINEAVQRTIIIPDPNVDPHIASAEQKIEEVAVHVEPTSGVYFNG